MENKEKKGAFDAPVEYPVRINRYLYLTGISSRREADRMIEKGQVLLNGKQAVLGQKVEEGDVVEVTKRAKKNLANRLYYAFNKPKGVVSVNSQRDEKDFRDFGNFPPGVAPVGRLDKDSRGLLFLTNDGRIVNKMLHPDFDHDKEYRVTVDKELKSSFKNKMEKGVLIEGYKTKPAKVHLLSNKRFSIILTEGKKHQIRRMVTALGYVVKDLKRVRIMNIKLGTLKPGESRKLSKKELDELFGKLQIIK